MAKARLEFIDDADDQVANSLAVCPAAAKEEHTKRDLREIDSNLSLPQSRVREMADLITEVNEMNLFRRFLDSKVPNSKRSFWRWFSLKLSDPEVLRQEIAKHGNFFAEMEEAFLKVRNCDEDAEEVIEELYEKLVQFYSEDKQQVDKDDSKKLCELHQKFVAERDKMENTMRRVENVNTRRQLRKTKDLLSGAIGKIDDVTRKMEQAKDENKNLLARVETLVAMNEGLMSHQEDLKEERLRDRDTFRSLEDKFERVLNMNEKLLEEKEEQKKKNDLMMALLQDLLKKPPGNGGNGEQQ